QTFRKFRRRFTRFRWSRREVEDEKIFLSVHSQFAAAVRLKSDAVARAAKMLKEHMRGSEGGVSAKIHFHRRRHPPNIVVTSAVNEEGRLGQVVFRRDLLQEQI